MKTQTIRFSLLLLGSLALLPITVGCSEDSAIVRRHPGPINGRPPLPGQIDPQTGQPYDICLSLGNGSFQFTEWTDAYTIEDFVDREVYGDAYQVGIQIFDGQATIVIVDDDPSPIKVELYEETNYYDTDIIFASAYNTVRFVLEEDGNGVGLFAVYFENIVNSDFLGYAVLPYYPIDCTPNIILN